MLEEIILIVMLVFITLYFIGKYLYEKCGGDE